MDSPAKRRKTSETTGIPVAPELLQKDAHRSRRPSFQSPTRASLARSNPDVLERALSRSPSRRPVRRDSEQPDARNIGLRDRKALRPSLNAAASPLTRPRPRDPEAPESSPNRRPSGIQAFSKPPRRISKRILPGDLVFGSPLPPSKPPQQSTPEGQLAQELGSAIGEADIGAPDMDMGPDPGFDDDSLEPDLPPTPTQLGLVKAPDRRLLSSSPSMRQEKRSKRRTANALPESPLKAVNFRSPPSPDLQDLETASDLGGSAAVQEKRSLREKSAADLRRLEKEVEELETWAKKIESSPDLRSDSRGLDKFLSLLISEEANRTTLPITPKAPKSISSLLATLLPFSANIPRPKRQTSPLPTNPFALHESSQSLPYLTAFAPLNLKTRTTRRSHSEGLSETHTLTFSPHLHSQQLSTTKTPEPLRRWIDTRLQNPLLKLDVATLCWGINRYWECAVSRARLWAYIDHKYGPRASKSSKEETIAVSDLRRLVPHLDRSVMVINGSSVSAPKVLLSNSLVLDEWTGEPRLRAEISVSVPGMSRKIEMETKKLFYALLGEDGELARRDVEGGVRVDAVVRATEGVLGALFGGG
ncbi:uncharacterized protein N7515_001761 [Penicillium bovifimosum]|uniref:Uncharacterized protein n=1 Tax=Penicillium bovifimosum TaxID=126998 RepID=A0A9W9HAC7_9EURO|nr:uncharacterized protein N7515_001761 [Penicillium bovifimosum]KAJ5142974.1 hypothetical protein N7515_001761 [Penicillium bovifimosum]